MDDLVEAADYMLYKAKRNGKISCVLNLRPNLHRLNNPRLRKFLVGRLTVKDGETLLIC